MNYLANRGELEYRKIFHSGEFEVEHKVPEVCLNIVTMRAHITDVGSCDTEFVQVTENFIYVVINNDIVDDIAIAKAIVMVGELPNLNYGTIKEFKQAVHSDENKTNWSKRTH